MPSPSLIDYFNAAYDTWSIPVERLSIPRHFDTFLPDAPNNTGCRMVIMPSPRRLAINYISEDKFILVGVYRDTGRPDVAHPVVSNIPWIRSAHYITLTHANHEAKVGDFVYLYNTNVVSEQYVQVSSISTNTFTIRTNTLIGANSGAVGAYRLDKTKKFSEENVVFRIFPSFKLVPYTTIQALFESTDPNNIRRPVYMKDITSNQTVLTPSQTDNLTDYAPASHLSTVSDVASSLPKITVTKPDRMTRLFEHEQLFDADGNALKLRYDERGRVISPEYYDKANKNVKRYLTPPLVNEPSDGGTGDAADAKAWVYDYYGYEINDASRGPFNVSDVITRDTTVEGSLDNIKRKEQNGAPMYPLTQQLYDVFGNIVVGIRSDNTLVTERQRIPLELDNFGRPKKSPQ